MRSTLQILITLIALCSCSKQANNPLNEIELGMKVENVLRNLNLESNDVSIIQEPPLIYRGIMATMPDSTEIGISFERTPANLDSISKVSQINLIGKLKINGFAWKTKTGNGKIIGQAPRYWID